jgi:hypothetical protein
MGDVVEGIGIGMKAIEGAGAAVGFVEGLWAKADAARARKATAFSLLRAFYLEILHDLELLSVADFEALRGMTPRDKPAKALVARLETGAAAALLLGAAEGEGSEIRDFLARKGRLKNGMKWLVRPGRDGEEPVKGATLYENVLQAVSFVVVKVALLRRLSDFADDEAGALRKVAMDRRLYNVRERLSMIKEKLDELPGIRDMAR